MLGPASFARVARHVLRRPGALISALFLFGVLLTALLAPLITAGDPFNSAAVDLRDGFSPPMVRNAETGRIYWLGADAQGRDVLSALVHGARVSLFVALSAVLLAATLGICLGLVAGYKGGWIDALIMRVADVQLAVPPLLTALLVHSVTRGFMPQAQRETAAVFVVIAAIGLSEWVKYARTVRGIVAVEQNKPYVDAARAIGVGPWRLMMAHILPSAAGPILAIATLGLSTAIVAEATLSFLGVGVPPTTPSLGTLIRFGQQFLFSGEWWILLFPAVMLFMLSLAINVLGQSLSDGLARSTR